MWPLGHAAVGYLLYTLLTHSREGQPPGGLPTVVVIFGTQLPDLIDKPLAWELAVMPRGRTIGHSLLFVFPSLILLWLLVTDRRTLVTALSVGWLSHLFADAVYSTVVKDWRYAGFLFWPLTTMPKARLDPTFVAHLHALELTPFFYAQWVLTAIAFIIWRADGYPGLRDLEKVLPSVDTQSDEDC